MCVCDILVIVIVIVCESGWTLKLGLSWGVQGLWR